MEKNKRRFLDIWIIFVIIITFLAILATIFLLLKDNRERGALKEAVHQETEEEERPLTMEREEMEALLEGHKKEIDRTKESREEEVYVSPVDFSGIQKVNQDVYAWITIPGTVIDYPILQHETDNSYYLNYNIDGSYGYPGCIYTENLNDKDFTDNNTVIYGHNMKNGTMFADLHKYKDEAFFKENDQVIIYTPEGELHYQIFAAYVYDDRHLLYSFDFADTQVYQDYLDSILSMGGEDAVIRKDIAVTREAEIITLATCISSQPEKRLLVQAVLQSNKEETKR